jgi:hypothetical protein
LIFQRSVCWNPITAIFESQLALNPKNTPTKEDEIFTGFKHKESMIFTAVCTNDGTRRGFSSNQEIMEMGQNLGPAGL